MGDAKTAVTGEKLTMGENISYGAYFLGQNIFYCLITTFLVPFFTDVGIPPLAVAVLALVVKIWDAVNDPIFGGVADKMRFKKGKFLPWLRISLILIPLATVFLFALPGGMSLVSKIVWAAIGYILWDTAYTICDVPAFGIVTTMTDKLPERTNLITIGRLCAGVGGFAASVTVPFVRENIGGWFSTSVVLSAAALVFMAPICFKARERNKVRQQQADVSLPDMFRYIAKNKYMLIYFSAFVLARIFDIAGPMQIYVARYNMGKESYMGLSMLINSVPFLIIAALIPVLCKKIDKFTLFWWATIASIVLGVVAFFVGFPSLPVVMIVQFVRSIPSHFLGFLMFQFTPDCVEYGAYTTGVNASGIVFSLQTFSAKLQAAVAASLASVGLFLIKFVEGEGAVQVEGFPEKLWFLVTIIPSIGLLVSLPLLAKYKLRDKTVEVMAQYNAGKLSREDAEAKLASFSAN
jgi:sugar (glycoside-pentoside-hexuronide) transporter